MDGMQAFFTNLAIGAVVVPGLLLLFNYGKDPKAILEKLSEMTGNAPGTASSAPGGGGMQGKRTE
eukprot:CAMPEP_0197655816 /NCGR_PEP_ID=MMETSP1338-20131121/39687_1 /TAXON_ID=43686 ORGANISM="Pelagodinium beii, Strain RCC1491" /NCGR_SAMPLE_ID=MMETSP1338 /ASSEMBLY_ACC=CAM_ASM_000754 /LENGTH=64 /DNA_ID=CAMNT_0043231539 /DNA_START=52 /DNA_END=246 /DNA_ORIENTATION=-